MLVYKLTKIQTEINNARAVQKNERIKTEI